MCPYTVLTRRPNSLVQWCHECQTYQLIFNNLVLCFEPPAFAEFKDMVGKCYMYHLECVPDRNNKEILFNTPVLDMHFLFSTNEVGELLGLMQEAELAFIGLEKPGATQPSSSH